MFAGRRYTLLLAAVAALGVGMVLLRGATYGVGLHWDSINHISVARSLLAGEGWIEWHGGDYAEFPPLFPLLMAAPSVLFGFDPHAVAGPLNALLFGLTIFAAGHGLRRRIESRMLALWGCLAVALALHLTTLASWALSEPAFILFVTLSLFAIDRYLRDGKRASLIWAALFVALACQTRYLGAALVIILLPLTLLRPGLPLAKKLKHSAAAALIPAIPLGLWILSNLARTGSPFGPVFLFWDNVTLHRILNVTLIELAEWALPHPLGDEGQWYAVAPAVTALGVAAAFALAALIGFALIRAYRQPKAWRGWIFFCLHGGFVMVYFISIAIGTKFWGVNLGWMSRRFWAPMYIPLLFALVFLLDRFLIWLRQQPWAGSAVRLPALGISASRGTVILGLLLFIWLGNSVRLNGLAVIRSNSAEAMHLDLGYAAPGWVNDVIHFIRDEQLEGIIIANRDANVYIHTDPSRISAVHTLPASLGKLEKMIAEAAADTYLVFFNDTIPRPAPPDKYGLAELEAMPALERMAQLNSGVVFRVNPNQAE